MSSDILNCRCRHCGQTFPYLRSNAGATAECPLCHGTVQLPGDLQAVASIISRRGKNPRGLAMEIGGLIIMFFYPWGTILSIPLLILGWRKSVRLACSVCNTPIQSHTTRRCPNCKAAFLAD